MPSQFETELRAALAANPQQGRKAARIVRILDSPPSRRRTNQIARMERAARSGVTESGAVDWSRVDWQTLLPQIVKLLLALLPFLGAVPAAG